MSDISMTCNVHGFIKGNDVRIVTIKKIIYHRCRECQKIKDRKHAKVYREKNKDYYAAKKKQHYADHPDSQIERNRRYRERKRLLCPSSSTVEQSLRKREAVGSIPTLGNSYTKSKR